MSIVDAIASATAKQDTEQDSRNRQARIRGHEVFDMLWQEGTWTRRYAYRWLSNQFGYEFHFLNADEDVCAQAQAICMDKLEELGLL